MKLNMCTGGKVIIIHMICFCCRMKSMDTVVTKIVKILQKHMDAGITKNIFKVA